MKRSRLWIGLALSAIGLAVTFRELNFGEIARALAAVDYRWLTLAVGLSVSALFVRSVRWRAFFHPETIPLRTSFVIVMIAYMINTLLPLRAGEVARVQLIGESENQSKARSASTVFLEHVVDIVLVSLLLLVMITVMPSPAWLAGLAWAAVILGSLAIALMALAVFKRGRALAVLDRVVQRLPERLATRLHEILDRMIDGFSAMRSPGAVLAVLVWSAVMWGAGALMMWATLAAFDLPRSTSTALFLVGMSGVALAVPAAPGDVGVYHAIIVESLLLVIAADRAQAVSFAVVAHLLLFVPPLVLGGFYTWREPGMWGHLLRWLRQPEHEPEPEAEHGPERRAGVRRAAE